MNLTGFESASFIRNHYTTFQKGMKGGSKLELMAAQANTTPENLQNIDIGHEFRAVVGSFNPSFVDYLNGLEDVEYIEPNQIYKSSIMPATSQPKAYTPSQRKNMSQRRRIQKRNDITYEVPSWGLARINRRNPGDFSSYTIDEAAG